MSMTWNELVQQKRVAAEPATKQELDELRALVQRNLQDAALRGLSPDGKFGMAYNAAQSCVSSLWLWRNAIGGGLTTTRFSPWKPP